MNWLCLYAETTGEVQHFEARQGNYHRHLLLLHEKILRPTMERVHLI